MSLSRQGPLLAGLLLIACGGDSAPEKRDEGDPGAGAAGTPCYGSNDCPAGQVCNQFGYCAASPGAGADGGTALPEETAIEPEPPATGKRYVYVAIPRQDKVAKIDSTTLQVRNVAVGKDPAVLRTVPGEDVAVVVNRASSTATVLRSQPDGGDRLSTVATAETLNQLAMAPDGRHAIAFFDVRRSGGALSPHQSFQDLTVISLADGADKAVDVTVGFRPWEVQFSADAATAWVITEQGISTLDLPRITRPAIAPTVAVLRDPLKEAPATQVVVVPGGKLALARVPGLKALRVVRLDTGALADVALPGEPSDLALGRGGALAVVALRDVSQVALVDVPEDLDAPSGIELLDASPYLAGQAVLTADGKQAFLFTNATSQKVLLGVDLVGRRLRAHLLKKAVRTVVVAPDGETAIVVHSKAPGTPSPQDPIDDYLDKHEAYSLFDIGKGFVKLQLTDAPPLSPVFSPDGASAYLLQSSATLRAVEAIDLVGFQIRSLGLGSPPVAVGVVTATSQIYVAQDHSLGRMTFIDTATFGARTVTGYGLNSEIIE